MICFVTSRNENRVLAFCVVQLDGILTVTKTPAIGLKCRQKENGEQQYIGSPCARGSRAFSLMTRVANGIFSSRFSQWHRVVKCSVNLLLTCSTTPEFSRDAL